MRGLNRCALVAVPFAVCAALYAAVLRGHFLSDDMAVIYVLSGWQDHGELWSKLFSKFAAGLDAPSHYYRPLAFLTYGINLTLQGMSPLPWHLVNLAGHLAGGAAVYRISASLQPESASRMGPWLAAALFLLCGTSAEAVAWISGRYDIFATAFSLWAGALYLRSRTGLDRYEMGALACGVLALMSKESGVIAPGLIGCLAWIRHGGLERGPRWTRIARDLAPWLLLLAGYFALRLVLFGSMLQVYPGIHPLERIGSGGWQATVAAALPWIQAALPAPAFLLSGGALMALLVAGGAALTLGDRSRWRCAVGLIGAMLWSLALLLPHLSGLAANGEGGRLFYTTSALLALCIAVPFGARATDGSSPRGLALLGAIGVAAVAAQAVLLHAGLRDWRAAGRQMHELVAALPALSRTMHQDGYAFIIAPDAIGAAPFARNANGAMVLRPVQQQSLLPNMIVLLPANMTEVPAMLQRQLIPTFKRYTLDEATRLEQERASRQPAAADQAPAAPLVWPTAVWCWRADTAALVSVAVRPEWLDVSRWEHGIAEGLHEAGCDRSGRG